MLLKNDEIKPGEVVLPLRPRGKVALIGAFAEFPRFQGSGSSKARNGCNASRAAAPPRRVTAETPPGQRLLQGA